MLTLFKNAHFTMNQHTGKKAWWLVWLMGMTLMVAWLIGFVDIFIYYGDLLNVVPDIYRNTYFLSVFYGVIVMMIGGVIANSAWHYAHGRIFVCPPPGGVMNGDWIYP